jgi:hypothetical protein
MARETIWRVGAVLRQNLSARWQADLIVLRPGKISERWTVAYRFRRDMIWHEGNAWERAAERIPHPVPEPVKASYVAWKIAQCAGVNPVKSETEV